MMREEAEEEGREAPEPPAEARSWCARAGDAGDGWRLVLLRLRPSEEQHTNFSVTRCRSDEQIRAFFKSGGASLPQATANGAAAAAAELAARCPPPDDATFSKWFPGLALSKTGCTNPR